MELVNVLMKIPIGFTLRRDFPTSLRRIVMIAQIVVGAVFIVCLGLALRGAVLIVGDKQREFMKRQKEQVSGEETDGDDTRRESKEEDS
jgi:uncharacterized membrane protein (Fun14 family)